MKYKVMIGVVLIIQATLIMILAVNAYSDSGGTISITAKSGVEELRYILDSKEIPYKVEQSGSEYVFKTTSKLVRLLEDVCSEYHQVEPIYKHSHAQLLFAALFETAIIILYLIYFHKALINTLLKTIVIMVCYVVTILFLRFMCIYPCWL